MHGRHLILPHRHHVHLRSAGSECKLSKMPITPERIESAINISHSTRTMYSQMMEKWLRETMNMSSSEAEHHFSYHYLRLDYPLSAEANNSDYDGADTKSPIEELPKILDSLNIAYHFLMNQKTDSNQKYFSDFIEKTSHNLNEALGMVNMDISCMKRPDYKYNTDYVKLEYGVVVETLKLLNVIEVKYRAMSKQQWATPL